jgi:hypothetical protein
MQQVLQYSNVTERVQHAIQGQAEDVARSFNKELEKVTETQLTQTHETKEAENALIRDSDQRKPKHYARRLPEPKEEEEEKKEEQPPTPPAESGHGSVINVVA